jgi:hypothetical protein
MTDPKTAKKLAKARLKEAKKRAAAEATPAPSAQIEKPSAGGPTPAERSAAAAERQVRLQRLRVIIALAATIVGLLTLLLTTRPWTWLRADSDPVVEEAPPAGGKGTEP